VADRNWLACDKVYTASGEPIRRMPRVSIILPSFNRLRFLRAAVASVLAQEFQDWELVIADDGSDEPTRQWLRTIDSGRTRVLWLQHSGNPARVRNAALAVARGALVAFLDSDDTWAPAKLARQLTAMDGDAARWSYTACDRIDEHGRRIDSKVLAPPEAGAMLEPLLALTAGIAMPTVVAERALLEEIGGFDERQRFAEFHDLCLRLALRARAARLPQPLSSVRAHREHFSADRAAAHADWMRLYDKMAGMMPEPRLRELCRRMRARMALKVARAQAARRDPLAVRQALRDGAVLSWPALWPGALLAWLRARLPGVGT
jgi:glycosyltransferase involved in cell wall biosynthesis